MSEYLYDKSVIRIKGYSIVTLDLWPHKPVADALSPKKENVTILEKKWKNAPTLWNTNHAVTRRGKFLIILFLKRVVLCSYVLYVST